VLTNPLGCYEESRFPSYDAMIRDVMSFFEDDATADAPTTTAGPTQHSAA